jgi:hypothetical protein
VSTPFVSQFQQTAGEIGRLVRSLAVCLAFWPSEHGPMKLRHWCGIMRRLFNMHAAKIDLLRLESGLAFD